MFLIVAHYFIITKPYGVLSQFTREAPHHRVLGDLYDFPPRVYPVGRLDRDSEGLLILTDDGSLNAALLHPRRQHARTYYVRVEGQPEATALDRLRAGVTIRAKGKTHRCAPVVAATLPTSVINHIPKRDPPVRYRKTVPDTWLALTLTEGKNRQVRRMCAAVGHPVLRLIRHGIEDLTLDDVGGTVRQVEGEWLKEKLCL